MGTKMKILVVDDQEDARNTVAEIIHECGYEVKTAQSGEDVLRHLLPGEIHLVITDRDLGKGKMTGVDLARLLPRTKSGLPKVILMSGDNFSNEDLKLHPAIAAFIGKPFSMEEIRALIKHQLGEIETPAAGS